MAFNLYNEFGNKWCIHKRFKVITSIIFSAELVSCPQKQMEDDIEHELINSITENEAIINLFTHSNI